MTRLLPALGPSSLLVLRASSKLRFPEPQTLTRVPETLQPDPNPLEPKMATQRLG